jgi:hypothetical protein
MHKSSWEKMESEQLNTLISRQMLSGESATVARLLMTKLPGWSTARGIPKTVRVTQPRLTQNTISFVSYFV